MIGLVLLLGIVAAGGGDPLDLAIDRLDAAFRANLGAMPKAGLIRFSHRYHGPEGPEEDDPAPALPNEDTGLYAFDGPAASWEQSAPEAVLRARFFPTPEGTRQPGPPYSVRALTDGRLTLRDLRLPGPEGSASEGAPGGPGPEVSPGTDAFFGLIFLPIVPGGPATRIVDVAAGAGLSRRGAGPPRLLDLDEDALLDGRPVVALTLELPDGVRRIWVDPARGSMPVRIRDEQGIPPTFDGDGRPVSEGRLFVTQIDLDDFRQVGEGAWLPFREVMAKGEETDAHPAPTPTRTTTITEARLGPPPDRSTFRLDYREPVSPRIGGRPSASPAIRVWDLSAMAGLDPERLGAPAGPGGTDRLGVRMLDAAAALAAFGVLAAAIVLIARRGRARP